MALHDVASAWEMNSPVKFHHIDALRLEHNAQTATKNTASGVTICKQQWINK